MNKPTVLIIADGMSAGGTERQIVELLMGLRYKGSFCTAFGVLVKGGEREEEAMRHADVVLPIRQSLSYDFTLAFSLIGLVRKYNIDLIHTFGSVSDCAGVVAGKITGKPVVNGSIRSARPKLNRRDRISRLCMSFATKIVANSHAGIAAFGLRHSLKASVIYNGVDLTRFDNVPKVSCPKPAICMVGNFTRKKDQASLIRALPIMQQEVPSLNLLLVGRGRTLVDCRQLTEDLDLESSVYYFTDTDHPESLIMESQVGVLLSPQGEGISNVIIEYMALAKPVVASNVGGNREIVEHGKTGLLVADHSAETVAQAIVTLLGNPHRAEEMGLAGRKIIEQRFDTARMIDAYEHLYRQILHLN